MDIFKAVNKSMLSLLIGSTEDKAMELQNLSHLMKAYYLGFYLTKQKLFISHVMTDILRSEIATEKDLSSVIEATMLLCIQLGYEYNGVYWELIKPALNDIFDNIDHSSNLRAQAATALGVCSFICKDEGEEVYTVIRKFEDYVEQLHPIKDTPYAKADICCDVLCSLVMLLATVRTRSVPPRLAKFQNLQWIFYRKHHRLLKNAAVAAIRMKELADSVGVELIGFADTCNALEQRINEFKELGMCDLFQLHQELISEKRRKKVEYLYEQAKLIIENCSESTLHFTVHSLLKAGMDKHIEQNPVIQDIFELEELPLPSEDEIEIGCAMNSTA